MVKKESAKEYLRRRISEHDLGVSNGNKMNPDTVALATLVLDMDQRLDELLELLRRQGRYRVWLRSAFDAVIENKGAVALVMAALAALIASISDKLIQFFGG